MKAITQRVYGAPADVLTFAEMPTPVAKAGEVLIRVRAAGVDAGVWHTVRGEAYIARLYFGLTKPKQRVPGRDLAGTVEAVGEGVTRFTVGDAVWAEHEGAYAEYVAVPQQWVEAKPEGSTFEEAAVLSVSGKTALQGMRDAAKVGPGTRIVINGASSGVGVYAVQVAKALGAEVTGVCSGRNAELVRSLGADHVVDYTVADFTAQRYDVLFDLIGNRGIAECRRALVPGGRLVLSSGSGGKWFGPVGKLLGGVVTGRATPFTAVRRRADFVELRRMVEAGTLRPVIDRTFALAEAAAAVTYVESGRARGKVVLTL